MSGSYPDCFRLPQGLVYGKKYYGPCNFADHMQRLVGYKRDPLITSQLVYDAVDCKLGKPKCRTACDGPYRSGMYQGVHW